MATVVLLGTLDTKGIEYDYLCKHIQSAGGDVILIDAGIKGTPLAHPDISRDEVAQAVGANVGQLAIAGDPRGGFLTGVLDITTTEPADELVGGILSAGPDRLEAAGKLGLPQIVSLGALDMVNFGPIDSVPEKFAQRKLYKHNLIVTLMRTTPEECAELGRLVARKLNQASGPTVLFIPLRGISMIATEGGAFYDPEADRYLIENVKAGLPQNIEVHELDMEINDPRFAEAMAQRLDELIRAQSQISA